MTASPYLNEPVAMLLREQLTDALLTAQALAENSITHGEQLPPIVALALHQQLVELERCISRSIGIEPEPFRDPFDDPLA